MLTQPPPVVAGIGTGVSNGKLHPLETGVGASPIAKIAFFPEPFRVEVSRTGFRAVRREVHFSYTTGAVSRAC
jgi:hypothetical protein